MNYLLELLQIVQNKRHSQIRNELGPGPEQVYDLSCMIVYCRQGIDYTQSAIDYIDAQIQSGKALTYNESALYKTLTQGGVVPFNAPLTRQNLINLNGYTNS